MKLVEGKKGRDFGFARRKIEIEVSRVRYIR